MTALADLFPAEDFRFKLELKRGAPRDFFRGSDASGRLLAERRRWIEAEPARYLALQPAGEALVAEMAALCRAWGVADVAGRADRGGMLRELGRVLEPDLLLLAADGDGQFRLCGGALCFPTGWALEEKLGLTVEEIHGVVPGLNGALGPAIDGFLRRLRPGHAFHRDNWGLAATDELNLHPGRGLPAPAGPVDLRRLWLRVEHQAFVALPESRGVLFGIRIALHPLETVAEDEAARRGLARALASMPAAVARYKRVDEVGPALIERLSSEGAGRRGS